MKIDYRSDTVTKPTKGMLEAMYKAEVGDDVFKEDPTIRALETKLANMFGMEAAIFCSSGTLSNQIAIKCHTRPGDEIICDESSHIYQYEGGGIAFNAGASTKLIYGDYGRILATQVLEAINDKNDIHKAISSLVSIENTSNRGGGSCYDFEEIKKIKNICEKNHLNFHLDGARLFNALIAKNELPKQYGSVMDSISICLSKSLGCPVGSVLLGSEKLITQARRIRKIMGGGMRQAGYLAAAGIYALDHHIERLQQDHAHAKKLADAIRGFTFVKSIFPVETNILIFETKDNRAEQVVEKLNEKNILTYAMAKDRVRMVTHLDITEEMVEKTIVEIKTLNNL